MLNCTLFSGKSQSLVFTRQEISEIKQQAYEIASNISPRQLLTHQAMFSAYLWRAAKNNQAIVRRNERWEIVPSGWRQMLSQSKIDIIVANDWMSDYIKEYWPTAFNAEQTLRRKRKLHVEWGLFYFDVENRPVGAYWGKIIDKSNQATVIPPTLENVNIVKILIFSQVFDAVRREKINKSLKYSDETTAFDYTPSHGGMLVREMYNVLFDGICDFAGNVYGMDDLTIEVESVISVPNQIAWKWKQIKGMSKRTWERLVIKAGQVFDGLSEMLDLAISVANSESLGDLSEVPY